MKIHPKVATVVWATSPLKTSNRGDGATHVRMHPRNMRSSGITSFRSRLKSKSNDDESTIR
jgi:hypothetical protein